MLVKVCGITRVEDALAAVDLGADVLGFVFWPDSPRRLDPFRARAIAAAIPALVGVVGVFVNQPADYVNGVAALARLTAVQLHGDEDGGYVAKMTRPVIKAVSGRAIEADEWPRRVTLLVDSHDLIKRGGTGKVADWSAAAQLARSRRVLLAGGLNAGNVKDAVAQVRPFGIDVSSGVESSPGIKDRTRMAAFFEAVRR